MAGHRGMALKAAGYGKVLTASCEGLDLLEPQAVHGWFEGLAVIAEALLPADVA